MAGVIFKEEDIAKLKDNPHVRYISPKMLVFTQDFKRYAVEQSKQGKSIFQTVRDAGIDTDLFIRDYLYNQLRAWRKQNLNLPPKKKGCPPIIKSYDLNKMTMEQLRARCALQEAEIEFLKKSTPWIKKIGFIQIYIQGIQIRYIFAMAMQLCWG